MTAVGLFVCHFPFSISTLLIWQQEVHPACKKFATEIP